ncbi:MAG: thiol-disulfide oxidoreductase DCC family protein [Mycobacterium sp.]
MQGTLFFDGECEMCTRSRNLLERMNRTGYVVTEPYQHDGTAERLGIADDRLPESVWWLDATGQVSSAAEACNAAVSAALGTRLPLSIYRLPGMRFIQERIYHWVATHRYRFPGTTPYCQTHPAGC